MMSAAWPAFGGIIAYVLVLSGSNPVTALVCITAAALLCVAYLCLLRVLPKDFSLLVDLAFIVSVFELVQSSPGISGIDNSQIVSLKLVGAQSKEMAPYLVWIVFAMVALGAIYLHISKLSLIHI